MERILILVHPAAPGFTFQIIMQDNPDGIIVSEKVYPPGKSPAGNQTESEQPPPP